MSVQIERTFCDTMGGSADLPPPGWERESQTLARDAHERQTRQGRDTSPLSRTLGDTWTVRMLGRFLQFADPTGDVERVSDRLVRWGVWFPAEVVWSV
jgi:hypothetical protein